MTDDHTAPAASKWEGFLRHYGAWLLAALTLLVLLPGSDTLPLIDRDEPRFAQATREMMERGEWIIPYFNGEYRFDKPVLIYWMMRPFYNLMGVNELAARMPSILCTLALILVVFRMGRRFFDAVTGFAATFGLLTCLQIQIHGRSAVADMPMVLAVTLSLWALYELLIKPGATPDRKWFWVLYLSQGLGFLAKGPLTQVLPLVALLLYRFALWRKPLPWKNLRLHWGIPVIVLIMAAWGIPALIRTDGEFWRIGMGKHVVERGIGEINDRRTFVFYYFATAFLSLCPWIAFLGWGWRILRREWTPLNVWLLSFLAAPYVIFSLYATRLPHYVLPGFAAFFLILAQGLKLRREDADGWPRVFFWVATSLYGLVALLVFLAGLNLHLYILPAIPETSPIFWSASAILTGLILMSLAVYFRRMRYVPAALLLVVCSLPILAVSMRKQLPAIQMREVMQSMPAETEFIAYRYSEPSLVFYGNRRWTVLTSLDEVNQKLRQPGPKFIVGIDEQIRFDKNLRKNYARLLIPKTGSILTESEKVFDGLFDWRNRGFELGRNTGLNYARSEIVGVECFYRR
ncbi:MAG: glycosyltransferase family 39 protein [Verrucomicrobiae bacterium]|nr:glycosyltransferase family 39 protein [Verrucomicrobiae bacterium]